MKLIKTDFEGLGVVAKHCDQRKLDVAINEADFFDLKPLLCDFYYAVNTNWENATTSQWSDLINGGSYTSCNGVTIRFQGIKKALTYFAYARYIIINSFDETPNGMVEKTNQFSIPKPLKELQSFATKYKDMGLFALKDAQKFICSEKDFPEFSSYNFNDCEGCGCVECDGERQAIGFGIRGQNISKKI